MALHDEKQKTEVSGAVVFTIIHNIYFNTLRPRQDGGNFPDDVFKCIFSNENAWIPIKISLRFVPNGPMNDIPALVRIMAWRRPGDKPLSEPMMVSLPTHICVTRPQWVKENFDKIRLSNLQFYSSQAVGQWDMLSSDAGWVGQAYFQ